MTGQEKEIVCHLSEDDLNRLLTETDDEKVSKRLIFVKRLYKGATLEDAADDVGMSQSTGSRWAKLWSKGGLGLLTPSFGGGRPPKLTEQQRARLLDLLEDDEPWKKQEIQHLINTEFDVFCGSTCTTSTRVLQPCTRRTHTGVGRTRRVATMLQESLSEYGFAPRLALRADTSW